jgi:hypothetical protein
VLEEMLVPGEQQIDAVLAEEWHPTGSDRCGGAFHARAPVGSRRIRRVMEEGYDVNVALAVEPLELARGPGELCGVLSNVRI